MRRSERAAAHGLHDDAGNAAGLNHFILFLCALGRFPVIIIDLELNKVPVGGIQNFMQNLRRIMEGEAGIPNRPCRLFCKNKVDKILFFYKSPNFPD